MESDFTRENIPLGSEQIIPSEISLLHLLDPHDNYVEVFNQPAKKHSVELQDKGRFMSETKHTYHTYNLSMDQSSHSKFTEKGFYIININSPIA